MVPFASGAVGGRSARAHLAEPLNGASLHKRMQETTACYFFHADGSRWQPGGETSWLIAPWRVAQCNTSFLSDMETIRGEVGLGQSSPPDASMLSRVCTSLPRERCPRTRTYQGMLEKWGGVWPRGWIHCDRTISPKPRQMKNLAAFTPGAVVYVNVAMPGFLAVQNGVARADVRLLHLVSYEHMGIVRVSCVPGFCSCQSRDIDAHKVDRRRNVSIYVDAVVPVTFTPVPAELPVPAPVPVVEVVSNQAQADTHQAVRTSGPRRPPRCRLALRVLRGTSSGEHKWVLTRVTVTARPPART
jgi:hypothetical protein